MTAPKMTQWWKNGDHPRDKSTEIPPEQRTAGMVSFLTEGKVVKTYDPVDPEALCDVCSSPMRIHGVVDHSNESDDWTIVHPGDYVSDNKIKGAYLVEHPDPMAQAQKRIEESGMPLPQDES